MSKNLTLIIIALASAIVGGLLTYLLIPKPITNPTTIATDFTGAGKYNCQLSDGEFVNGQCLCPMEKGQTPNSVYDPATGFCQSAAGGPGGRAFSASIGLPFGDYGYYNTIIVGYCQKSGGQMSGAACICPEGKSYDKTSGVCR